MTITSIPLLGIEMTVCLKLCPLTTVKIQYLVICLSKLLRKVEQKKKSDQTSKRDLGERGPLPILRHS